MTRRSRTHTLLLSVAIAAVTCFVGAQTPRAQPPRPAAQAANAASPATAPLTAKIPIDPAITSGTYPNGLRYYVRTNKQPAGRAELRLVVNAGSILEDEDQRGLAHLIEHMCFNGTAHFPKQALVDFMQSIGMRFGAHVNAYTSFDETVFMLQVPTDKPEVLDRAMLILEDWAHNVTFDPTEIDKERGVVTEEWRLGLGAQQRMQDKQLPILLKGSRYADRLPIGKMDVVQHAPYDRLTSFYKTWYRPDLMAVVAVGDFDKTAVEGLIKSHFSTLANPANEKPRPVYDVPTQPGTLYAIATDKEAPASSVTVFAKMPARSQALVSDYRRQIVEGLFGGALSERFGEMAQKPDAPFLQADASRGPMVRVEDASTLGAVVKPGGIATGLDALVTEADRVAQFGFTASELDREKQEMLRSVQQAAEEKDNTPSASLADEYIRNFTTGEPIPGIAYEYGLYQRFLPEITLAEVNGLAKDWIPDHNRVVAVNAPDKPDVPVPSETDLSAVLTKAAAQPLKPWADTTTTAPLMASAPAPGSIVKTTTDDPYGITEWTLSNGVHVVLKPTTFKADEILFRASAPGGTSLASDADWVAARTADQVVAAGGLGTFGIIDLQKMLAGKVAAAAPFFTDTTSGLSGGGSKKDLDTLFQLIYLRFTAPRADPTIFGVMTSQTKAALANQQADPEFAFGVALEKLVMDDQLRAQPFTAQTVDQMSLDRSMAFYKARFADAGNFTFTFVGSFDPATLKPLVERYLASLPASDHHETWRDEGPHPLPGVRQTKVEQGQSPKSEAALVYTGPFEWNQTQRAAIRGMAEVLNNRLREVIREDLSGTYSISVGPSYNRVPKPEYRVDVDFGCSPDRTDDLVKKVLDEIEKLKTAGPTEQQVDDVKTTLLRDAETSFTQNDYLVAQISYRFETGEGLDSLFHIADYYKALSPASIQAAAKLYLNDANRVTAELFPAKKAPR